jgi:hypothetical protein
MVRLGQGRLGGFFVMFFHLIIKVSLVSVKVVRLGQSRLGGFFFILCFTSSDQDYISDSQNG